MSCSESPLELLEHIAAEGAHEAGRLLRRRAPHVGAAELSARARRQRNPDVECQASARRRSWRNRTHHGRGVGERPDRVRRATFAGAESGFVRTLADVPGLGVLDVDQLGAHIQEPYEPEQEWARRHRRKHHVDPEQALQTRREFLERYGDTPVLVLGTHFATPTAGRIVRKGGAFRFEV